MDFDIMDFYMCSQTHFQLILHFSHRPTRIHWTWIHECIHTENDSIAT